MLGKILNVVNESEHTQKSKIKIWIGFVKGVFIKMCANFVIQLLQDV